MSELAASVVASQAPLKVGGGRVGLGARSWPVAASMGAIRTNDIKDFLKPMLTNPFIC